MGNNAKPSITDTPETLDLGFHARLALNHLTRNVDEKKDYLPYFRTILLSDPPEARHENWDCGDLTGRYVDAIILSRQMTGDQRNLEVEAGMRKLLLSTFSEGDGLTYRKKSAWSDYEADIFDQSSTLLALVSWYLLERDESIRLRIEAMIEGLWELAVKKDGFCFFRYPTYLPGGKEARHKNNWPHADPCHHGGRIILPLARYYEETESPAARKLIEGLSEYVISQSGVFGVDGGFEGHFHSRAATVAGILRYAIEAGRDDRIEWCRKVYDWARLKGLSMGWFPEFNMRNPSDASITCETCIITDMIHCAVKLAQAGYAQYWDDVDRYVRNHLVESQLRDNSWLSRSVEKADTEISSFRDVPARVQGGFAGWSKPNDYLGEIRYPSAIERWLEPNWRTTRHMMNCCSPAGARGFFLVWENMVDRKGKDIYVNLCINRENDWVKIHSYLPHRGEVEIMMKTSASLHVRLPNWVNRDAVYVELDGKRFPPQWITDRYVSIGALDSGSSAKISYPQRHRTESVTAGGEDFEIQWRGNTVTQISPQGKNCPLYLRKHMENENVPQAKGGVKQKITGKVHW